MTFDVLPFQKRRRHKSPIKKKESGLLDGGWF